MYVTIKVEIVTPHTSVVFPFLKCVYRSPKSEHHLFAVLLSCDDKVFGATAPELNFELITSSDGIDIYGITYDPASQYLYWTLFSTGKINTCKVDQCETSTFHQVLCEY